MEEWGENRDALIDLFGKVRDEWMDNDLTTWIGANRYFNQAYSDGPKCVAISTVYMIIRN